MLVHQMNFHQIQQKMQEVNFLLFIIKIYNQIQIILLKVIIIQIIIFYMKKKTKIKMKIIL